MTATGRHRKRLLIVLAITGTVFVAEVIGGLLSGSLALLADAGHMLTDSTGLLLAVLGASLATRAATARRTFGLQRAEVLAALANALLLVAISVWVLIQAVDRLRAPTEIETGLMLGVAIAGAVANVIGLLVLRRGQAESLNVRGAYLEVLGDLVGSVAVIVAAILITLTGWTRFDAIASLAIFVLILPRAWSLLREVVDVLLEATPRGVDLDEVRDIWTTCRRLSTCTTCTPGLSPAASRCCPRTSSSTSAASPRDGRARCSTAWASAWAGTSTSSTAPSRSSRSGTASTNSTITPETGSAASLVRR